MAPQGRKGMVGRFEKIDGHWQSLAIASNARIAKVDKNLDYIPWAVIASGIMRGIINDLPLDGKVFHTPTVNLGLTSLYIPPDNRKHKNKYVLGAYTKRLNEINGAELRNWRDLLDSLHFILKQTRSDRRDERHIINILNVFSDDNLAHIHNYSSPIQNTALKVLDERGSLLLSGLAVNLLKHRVADYSIIPTVIAPDGEAYLGAQYSDRRLFNVDVPQPLNTAFDFVCPCGTRLNNTTLEELTPLLDWYHAYGHTRLPLSVLELVTRYGRKGNVDDALTILDLSRQNHLTRETQNKILHDLKTADTKAIAQAIHMLKQGTLH
ncbi:hypothetical protein [Arcanobacterium phocae]|uniref:hypothetical protein n=1 Tax=Arcanobacterium phocae TaxID=131112 RepID=UPI001C0F121B|nr:hypothetical protein [Arcanobacterium phocae]